jgi:integrase
MRQPLPGTTFQHDYPLGLSPGPDGGHIFNDGARLHYTDAAGKPLASGPLGEVGFVTRRGKDEVKTGPVADDDDKLLELYIANGSVKRRKPLSPLREKEARAVYTTFKTVVGGKALAKVTHDDVRDFLAFLEKRTPGVKSNTLRRTLVPLVSLVNRAIFEKKLPPGFNPFEGVVINRDDSEDRGEYTEADMKSIRANLHKLRDPDQLLVRLISATGMRLSEAWQITGEQIEDGVRYCVVGKKTEASKRRIPFPKEWLALPQFKKTITGPIVTGDTKAATKRMAKFLREIGVMDEENTRKLAPFHSFRHRAETRMFEAFPKADKLRNMIGG